ncbi:hypothetical protein CN445_03415 [Bacillus cereus]|nr:hypothetical protein CN485_27960 [Bacillus cereus]PEW91210.1 hypothetical protein CN445_03415 [Bacillus cereus]PEX96419.1 hypothetical protein CN465_06255 [Bacillus cereus]PFN70485.1 hypothetical protein COJ62_20135 [Bacillus cereus]PGP60674.1 hypothetical protein CN998_30460 [Bacillus cereus]
MNLVKMVLKLTFRIGKILFSFFIKYIISISEFFTVGMLLVEYRVLIIDLIIFLIDFVNKFKLDQQMSQNTNKFI